MPRILLPICLTLALGGCLASLPGSAPTALPVLPDLSLGVPNGYCLDKGASHAEDAGSSFLMGRCTDRSTAVPAVLRVSFGAPGSASALAADPKEIAAFFLTEQGRAMLAPNGDPSHVRIVTALASEGGLFLRIFSRSEGEYWRAIAGIRGRMVTVSAIGTAEAPLPEKASRAAVETALAAQRAANAGGPG